jgi:hypothetical protein
LRVPISEVQILAAHEEFWDRVWWNQHQKWLRLIENGEEPLTEAQIPILERAKKTARRIERGLLSTRSLAGPLRCGDIA